jgi:hypothetical protein
MEHFYDIMDSVERFFIYLPNMEEDVLFTLMYPALELVERYAEVIDLRNPSPEAQKLIQRSFLVFDVQDVEFTHNRSLNKENRANYLTSIGILKFFKLKLYEIFGTEKSGS